MEESAVFLSIPLCNLTIFRLKTQSFSYRRPQPPTTKIPCHLDLDLDLGQEPARQKFRVDLDLARDPADRKQKKMGALNGGERDWTSLPQGPLYVISEHLQSNIDVVRFRSVCPSWRSAARRRQQQSPCIVASATPTSEKEETQFALFARSGARIPDVPNIPLTLHRIYWTTSHGWLADLSNIERGIPLFNPTTSGGDRIYLPPVTDMPFFHEARFALSANPATTPDYTAAFYYLVDQWGDEDDGESKLAIYRSGDEAWSHAEIPRIQTPYADSSITFYNGLIYIAAGVQVLVCDPAATEKQVVQAAALDPRSYVNVGTSYFAQSCGNLMLVCQFGYFRDRSKRRIEVFKLEFCDNKAGRGRIQGMVKMESLGDRALLVAQNSSFSISATEFPAYKANHVYFKFGRRNPPVVFSLGEGGGKEDPSGHDPFFWPELKSIRPWAWLMPSLF